MDRTRALVRKGGRDNVLMMLVLPAAALGCSAHFPLHPLTKLPVQEWANANQLGSGWPLQHRLPLSFTLQEKKVILPSDSPALH